MFQTQSIGIYRDRYERLVCLFLVASIFACETVRNHVLQNYENPEISQISFSSSFSPSLYLFLPLFFSLFSSRFCGCEKRTEGFARSCDGQSERNRSPSGSPLLLAWAVPRRVHPVALSNKRPQVSQHFAFSRTLRSAFACASYSRGRRKNI